MANEVNVSPRYLSYNKADVQALLDKVNDADAEPTAESTNMISSGAVAAALGNYNTKEEIEELTKEASEQEVRGIVKNWSPDSHDDSSDSDSSDSSSSE